MLQRAKPALGPGAAPQKDTKKKKKLPKLEDFLQARDYTGAITLLEVSFCNFFSIIVLFASAGFQFNLLIALF